uniref:Uncharacterized protein n=1 Tax=Ixodes ricinus TaxID=34613 RepID=A0A0K8R462_IXORI
MNEVTILPPYRPERLQAQVGQRSQRPSCPKDCGEAHPRPAKADPGSGPPNVAPTAAVSKGLTEEPGFRPTTPTQIHFFNPPPTCPPPPSAKERQTCCQRHIDRTDDGDSSTAGKASRLFQARPIGTSFPFFTYLVFPPLSGLRKRP